MNYSGRNGPTLLRGAFLFKRSSSLLDAELILKRFDVLQDFQQLRISVVHEGSNFVSYCPQLKIG
jgi:hypothetical protein